MVFMVMSKHLIYTTEIEAINREEKAINDANFSDGYTIKYCDILKHPTEKLWAIIIDKNYYHLFTQIEIDSAVELSNDWYSDNL
jgi:hypothetical protein